MRLFVGPASSEESRQLQNLLLSQQTDTERPGKQTPVAFLFPIFMFYSHPLSFQFFYLLLVSAETKWSRILWIFGIIMRNTWITQIIELLACYLDFNGSDNCCSASFVGNHGFCRPFSHRLRTTTSYLYFFLGLQYSKCHPGTPGVSKILSKSSWIQNYLYDNTMMLFAFFTLILIWVYNGMFQRLHDKLCYTRLKAKWYENWAVFY